MAFVAAELSHVQLLLKEMVTADQVEALGAGRIDAGILRMPIDRRGLEVAPISREPFMLAAPAGHPLAERRTLSAKDLDRQPMVMYAPMESRYHHDLVSSVLRAAGISPNFVQYALEVHTILALVRAGIGIALVPEVAGNLGYAGVDLLPISLNPKVFSELTLVWRKRSDNPALRVLTEEVLPRFLAARE